MKSKILTLIALSFIFLVSCNNTKTEYSPVLHEKCVIISLIYSPSEHHTQLTNTMMDDFNSPLTGVDINGNKGVKIGKMNGRSVQITSTTIPERYGVVFQCQHGTFIVEGEKEKHKILYQKLYNNVHDTVDVLYKEVYTVTYDDKNKDGVDEVVSRVLTDFDFIDAQLIKK